MVFTRLTSAVTRHPWVVVAIWVVTFFGLSTAGAQKAADVLTDDQAASSSRPATSPRAGSSSVARRSVRSRAPQR